MSPASQTPPDKTVRRGLLWAIAADCNSNLFAQLLVGSPIMVLLFSQLGLSKSQIGLVLSFLPFAGILALFVAPAVARHGYRRVFLAFWTTRKLVMGMLIAAPFIATRSGSQAAFLYITLIMGVFAICRAVGETALDPWSIEYVPSTIRGKFTAIDNVVSFVAAFVVLGAVSYFMGRSTGLERFIYVIAGAVFFGLVGVACASRIPGGKPRPAAGTGPHWPVFRQVLADRNMRLFLVGAGLVTLIAQPLGSFLPLFMREQVGLRSDQVVLLQNGSMLGSLALAYLWGWLADRYGSKVAALSGMGLRALLPVIWLLMPRGQASSLPIALGAAFLDGVANVGWSIGASRLLFVNLVPPAHKTEYLAVRYSWFGIIGGVSPLLAGQLLDRLEGLHGRFLFVPLDAYTVLFVAGIGAMLLALVVLSRIRVDGNRA